MADRSQELDWNRIDSPAAMSGVTLLERELELAFAKAAKYQSFLERALVQANRRLPPVSPGWNVLRRSAIPPRGYFF